MPAHGEHGGGQVVAERVTLGDLVQVRLAEAQQEQCRHDEERKGGEVRDPGRCRRGEHPAGQRAECQRQAFGDADAADNGFETVTGPGLLEDSVVNNGVERSRLHREVHAEEHRRHDVHPDAVAQPAQQHAGEGAEVADDEDATPAPPIGKDPGHDLEEGDKAGVRRGHHSDRLRGETDVAEKELLDGDPQGDASEEERGDQRG